MKNNLDTVIEIVSHYLEKNDFLGVDAFFLEIHYEFFPEVVSYFVKENKKFSSYIQSFVLKNKEEVCSGHLMEVCHSEFFSDSVSLYLDIHHIEVPDSFSDVSISDIRFLDGYRLYLQDISRYPILSEEEERRLGFRILEGDSDAIGELLRHNLRLVISVAKRYFGKTTSVMDLIQEGNLGLMKACQKFDVRKGYRFSTYATCWIRQAILRYIDNNQGAYRIPVHVHQKLRVFHKKVQILQNQLGRTPSIEEIAHSFSISVFEVREMLSLMDFHSVSLYAEVGEEHDNILIDFVPDESRNTEQEAFDLMDREEMFRYFELAHLTEQEKEVIRLRFGFYDGIIWTLKEVGDKFHFTGERARQVEEKALQKLRSCRNAKYYRSDTPVKELVLKPNLKKS